MLALARLIFSLSPSGRIYSPVRMRQFFLFILCAAIGGLAAAMGFILLVGSAYLWFTQVMTAAAAAATTGGALLVFAGLATLVAARLGRADPPAPASGNDVGTLLCAVQAAIAQDARSDTPVFALLALLAGGAVGASPHLRQVMGKLARGAAIMLARQGGDPPK